MKYTRSPSPSVGLPTPPESPRVLEPNHTSVLLDSLTSFYQQERYWIHHTRAALELAIAKGIDAPSSYSDSNASSPTPSDSGSSVDTAITIKSEPDASVLPPTQRPLWMRRKQSMKLKLDGISPHRRRRPHRAPVDEPGTRLLEMFSELVDARMESCQRINKLVQNTSRASFYIC